MISGVNENTAIINNIFYFHPLVHENGPLALHAIPESVRLKHWMKIGCEMKDDNLAFYFLINAFLKKLYFLRFQLENNWYCCNNI